jgi:uncharacterized coiled-coil protein SlyX
MTTRDTITELQMLLMEQQQAIETMSQQLIDQSVRFSEMEKKLVLLESKLSILAEQPAISEDPGVDRPPHY